MNRFLQMELANKTCLVVGASGAIGQAVAEKLYQQGARVALTVHSQKNRMNWPFASLKDPRVATFSLDVRKPKQVERLVSRVARKFGPIHALVNCSGVQGPVGAAHLVSLEAWRDAVEVNLLGSFYLIRAVLPGMLAASGGKIVQFSGGGAAYARPCLTAYSASKAALVRFTECLSSELSGKNIQINVIAPGPVKSRMWDELRAAGAAGGQQALAELEKMDATGGVSAERAAALVLFLVSNRSNGLTGRLISAVFDQWEGFEPRIPEIMASDAGTLRRVPFEVPA
jgi:NAD(P)-dependent dehydrogenase (short-subunit alcohol dehydrogenase family)